MPSSGSSSGSKVGKSIGRLSVQGRALGDVVLVGGSAREMWIEESEAEASLGFREWAAGPWWAEKNR